MNSGERTVVAVHGPDDRPQPDIVVDVACDDAQDLQLKPAHAYDDRHERQGKNGAGGEAVDADVSRHLKCNRTGLGRFGAEALIGQPINSLQLVIDPASQLEGGLAVVGMLSPASGPQQRRLPLRSGAFGRDRKRDAASNRPAFLHQLHRRRAAGYIFKCLDGCLAVTLNTVSIVSIRCLDNRRQCAYFLAVSGPEASHRESQTLAWDREMESGVNVVGAYPLSSAGWHGSMAT